MTKKYKISLMIIFILIIICLGLIGYKVLFYNKSEKKPTVHSSIVDNMENYGYALDNRDSKLFKEKYYELKEILDSDEIDYELYAKKISELFVIDLFTISNKINKYDVGGLDFLYESEKEMFKNKVMDTLYDYVEDNSYDSREQKLPTVMSTTIENVEKNKFEIDNKSLEAYEIKVAISYEEDMGYDKNAIITVVKDDNRMYIVKYATSN